MNRIFNTLIKIAPFTEKYIKDIKKRTELFLRLGLAVNIGYALFNVFTGVFYRSVWFGSVAVYYIMLCFIKFFLLNKGFDNRGTKEYGDLLTCGIMLLILSVAVTVIIYIMIWKTHTHHAAQTAAHHLWGSTQPGLLGRGRPHSQGQQPAGMTAGSPATTQSTEKTGALGPPAAGQPTLENRPSSALCKLAQLF